MFEMLKENAIAIQAGSALISAVAVIVSTYFIIWTTYFRKARRDRIDELKEEMQILLSDRDIRGVHVRDKDKFLDHFFGELAPRFQKPKYKPLHLYALRELSREGRFRIYQ